MPFYNEKPEKIVKMIPVKNVSVTLVHEGASETMKRSMTRIIDGKMLQAANREGRKQEAISIYNRIMGIKSTNHPYETFETDAPPSQGDPPIESGGAKHLQRMAESDQIAFADRLAAGIARGVMQALTELGIVGKKKSKEDEEAPTMKTSPKEAPKKKRERATL